MAETSKKLDRPPKWAEKGDGEKVKMNRKSAELTRD